MALAECLAALPQGLAPPKPPGEREIIGDRALMTWVSSFATYVTIVAEAHIQPVWATCSPICGSSSLRLASLEAMGGSHTMQSFGETKRVSPPLGT